MEDQHPDGLRIIRLEASNFKRLIAVEITPEGDVIKITGANAQGKSSVLDGMWAALGGGKATKDIPKPIHEGATKAHVTLDLGDMTVTRTWNAKGTALTVEAKDGVKFPSPQKLLDNMIGQFAFDPLEFAQMSSKDQTTALQEIVTLDIDLDVVADERRRAFEQRTTVNREVKTLAAQLAAHGTIDTKAPKEEVSSSDILREIEAAQATAASNKEKRKALDDQLKDATKLQKEIQSKQQELDSMVETGKRLRVEIDALVDPPIEELREKLANVEATNVAVRAAKEHWKIKAQLGSREREALDLTETIKELDDARTDALQKATFPIDGLSFGEDGVIYNNNPFSQASDAERLRVSFAIAMALNPRLQVIRIRNGSQLDPKNMALVAAMAKKHRFQLWIEIVDVSGKIGIVIEDGVVVADNQ